MYAWRDVNLAFPHIPVARSVVGPFHGQGIAPLLATERPITLSQGTNRLVRPEAVRNAVRQVLSGDWPNGKCPNLWDGKTAVRA